MTKSLDVVYMKSLIPGGGYDSTIGLSRRATKALQQQGLTVSLTELARSAPEVAEENDFWGRVPDTQETRDMITKLKTKGTII
jgi:hypothetical protein